MIPSVPPPKIILVVPIVLWAAQLLLPSGCLYAADSPFGKSQAGPVIGLPANVTAVAAGGGHTCVLTSNGTVFCWGDNRDGQLGDGSVKTSAVPVQVNGLQDQVTAITAGRGHTCASMKSGGVLCWGFNSVGQLGNGSSTMEPTPKPAPVIGLSGKVRMISASAVHTCALMDSGSMKCWGEMSWYSGDSEHTVYRRTPAAIPGLSSDVVTISTGGNHDCALKTTGVLMCWGQNLDGELGNKNSSGSVVPVRVGGLSDKVVAVAAGNYNTCVLTANSNVLCWGWYVTGPSGLDSTAHTATPIKVPGLTDVTVVLANGLGGAHTCALTATGDVKCWGANGFGQLGNASTVDSPLPVDVKGLSDRATAITVGEGHTCALIQGGKVKCWGYNDTGQLGNGMITPQPRACCARPAR